METKEMKGDPDFTPEDIYNNESAIEFAEEGIEWAKTNPDKPFVPKARKGIMRKYDELQKTLGKEFGKDKVSIVTDSKGNSWYEVKVPNLIREGSLLSKHLNLVEH